MRIASEASTPNAALRRFRPSPLALRIAAIVLVLDAVVLALAGVSVYGNRQQYYIRAEIISRNMSGVMAETVAGYLDRIDFALRMVVDQAEREGGVHPGMRSADDVLRSMRERVPEAEHFLLADADGAVHDDGAVQSNVAPLEFADRDYFKTLRDTPNAGLVMSPPLHGRVSGKWVLVLARRVNRPDGSFGGMAYASMPIQQVSDLFASVDLRTDDAIAMRGPLPSLGAIARFPEKVDGVSAIGNPAVSPQLVAMTAAHPEKGTYVARAGIDGIERVLSYHRVGDYPYYVLFGQSTQQMMLQWGRESIRIVILAAGFLLLTTGGGLFALRTLRARQALEGRLKLIEFAFDHQAEAVLLLGRHGDVVYGNTAAQHLFQRHGTALPGVMVWDLGVGVEQCGWQDHWNKLRVGDRRAVVADIRRPDGSMVTGEITSNYFAFGGQEFDVSIIRDIGEQLRYERDLREALRVSQALGTALARKNDELAQFAEILAHHMQEPVRQQHIFAQQLSRQLPTPLAPEIQVSLNAIMDAAQRHRSMLRDAQRYLSFDEANAGGPPLPGDAALDRALERLSPQIAQAGAVIERAPLPHLPIKLAALTEIFVALLDNAITYGPPGLPPHVHVDTHRQDGETVVSVSDNGIGIPAEYRDRVFRVFERLTPQPGQSGTGIGLALVRKIVESVGGRIWIEQPDEPGTRVCFSIPDTGAEGG
ncbi:MAG TPA: ATP-binding protein [Magnetospirillum sp.]|nr:ATP-binding protein [Magnetospirillum sp.]